MSTIAKSKRIDNDTKSVIFHGQSLLTLEQNGIHYAAMKPICENIGLNWDSQRKRIVRDDVLNSVAVMMTATGTDKKKYEMLCLPINFLNGWLFGVDSNRVKSEIKTKLFQYKKECYQALHDYWHGKTAEKPDRLSTVADRKPLVAAVNEFCGKTGAIYSDVWKMVHQRFGLICVQEMTVEQVPQAIDYIHGLLVQVQYGGIDIEKAMDNEMWRYVGILKHFDLSRALDHAKRAADDLYQAIGIAQSHSSLIYDAFGEQKKLTSLGEGGSQTALEQARAFIERQDARKQSWEVR